MAPNRTVTARVQMLDDSIHTYDVKMKSYANVIHQAVMKDLNLLESDYFGIQYQDKHENKIFLDPLKKIKTQIRNINNIVLKFVVKFFPPDPGQLQEEYTRYLFALQIKHDIVQGMLPCNDTTMTVLASYVAQAEFGDWNASDCTDLTYLKDLRLLPPGVTDEGILSKISEQHKAKAGQSPADADLHLLEIVRRLEHYGLRLQRARDQENTEINLAIAHMGVVVFRSNSKINTFNWARIRKLSFKKKRFLIKLKTEANVDNRGANVGDILEFVMISRDACKTFWRHCIEYHAFFRLEIHPDPKPQPKILKRGSTFRYSGKTQKQLHELVRNSNFRRTTFTRASKRKPTTHPGNASWATPTVPTSISVNGSKGDLYPQSIDVVPSPIKVDVEVNGRIFNKSEVSSMNEESPKPTQESYNETPSSADAAKSWQLQSENLHSSVVLTNESNLPYEKPGNKGGKATHAGHANTNNNEQSSMTSPDLLNGVMYSNDSLNYYTNDNNESPTRARSYLSKNILSIESVSTSSKSSRSSINRSSSSSSRRSRNQPLPPPPPPPMEIEEIETPPPLPPKLGSPIIEHATNRRHEMEKDFSDILFIESSIVALNEIKPSLHEFKSREHSMSLSASELSIPSLSAGEPRSPSQYAIIEQKMIKAGLYSVPKKPPIPPNKMKYKKCENFDSEIDQALNELDIAKKSLNCSESDNENDSESANGMYGVVIDSDDEASNQSSVKDVSFGFDKTLLTPIPMKFNDYYAGPDYGSTDALSSFAVEMEASFDRICQSMSNDRLDENPKMEAPARPLTSSLDVLNDGNSFCNITYGNVTFDTSHVAVNANNNDSYTAVPRRYVRRESDDTVDL